jgi:hypothetical protein
METETLKKKLKKMLRVDEIGMVKHKGNRRKE